MSTELMAPRKNKRSNDHDPKNTSNRRNGYINKTVKSTYGDIPVEVPRDRNTSFEPQAIPKHTRDVSGIEDKVLSMYDISETGFALPYPYH